MVQMTRAAGMRRLTLAASVSTIRTQATYVMPAMVRRICCQAPHPNLYCADLAAKSITMICHHTHVPHA